MSKSNAKHDLGVLSLYMGGIGKQKAGDTLKVCMSQLKRNLYLKILALGRWENKLSAKVVVTEGVQSKNIFF